MYVRAISIFKSTFLLLKLIDFIFIANEAQLRSLQIFNIGPYKFANRSFTFIIFCLIEQLITNCPISSVRVRSFIQDDKDLIIKIHLIYISAILLKLADDLMIEFIMTDMPISITFDILVLHSLSSIINQYFQ